MLAKPTLFRIPLTHAFKPFDCGDKSLNDFLVHDSIPHQRQLFAVTYVIENDMDTIGYFSLMNDKIDIEAFPNDIAKWKKVRRGMPNGKRYKSFPAMKIGRLGVHSGHSKNKWGTTIIDYLKKLFVTDNRTGCLFITVDAYIQSVGFYEKNGFAFMTDADINKDTRQMYFQLRPIEQ